MNDALKKNYFPQLQVVRGIAALLVILNHTYSKKIFFKNIPVVQSETIFTGAGVAGLTLFFVLSGFLITYLLSNEKHLTGTINIRKFYIRRILRIWPLYFLLILIGHFILPFFFNSNFEGGNMADNFWIKSLMYILILPNYVYFIFKPHNPYIDVTWSIGVEEQFYFVWPHLIKRKKSIVSIIFLLILVQLAAEIFTHYAAYYKDDSALIFILNKAVRFVEWTRAGYFAFGAMTAIFFTRKLYLTNELVITLTYISPWLFLIVFIAGFFWYFYLQFLLLAFCYCFFQLYLITKNHVSQGIVFGFFEWLGKISYGLYLWHCIVIVFVFKLYQHMHVNISNQAIASLLLYLLILLLTVFLSWISYTFFESFFLNLKRKYSVFVKPKLF